MGHRNEVFLWKGIRGLLALTVGLSLLGLPESNAPSSLTEAHATPMSAAIDRPDTATRAQTVETFRGLPLRFEANHGVTDPQVDFIARGRGYTVFLTPREAVLNLRGPATSMDGHGQGQSSAAALRVRLVGANPQPRVTGLEELPGRVNYFRGNHPAQWRTNIPTYAKVHYEEIYSGIDLVDYGNQRQLEYDFVVRPGADPTSIVLAFEGAENIEVDPQGDLLLHLAGGAIRHRKPVIYQEVDGDRREIAGGYVLKGAREVGFKVAAYDGSRPLIIDPVLYYSTYLGGVDSDTAAGIAVDANGYAYVTGETSSTDFPATAGAFRVALAGLTDGFVAKLDPSGSALAYSTYLGGTGDDDGDAVVVDANGSAYVTGSSKSTDFPTTAGALQPIWPGGLNSAAFVTKLNPTGTALVYSTYLDGTGDDQGRGIAIDASGNAYIAGETDSTNFPTTAGAFQTARAGNTFDAFVTKLDPTGSALVYSTYLGGARADRAFGIALDALDNPNAYVAGRTSSSDFPTTAGAFQTTSAGLTDVFVTKLDPTGAALVYSTYLGGSRDDRGRGIAVGASGYAYITGEVESADFPATAGAPQTTLGSTRDAFVTKLDPTGSTLVYSTYLGGATSTERGAAITLDAAGSAYITGETLSTDFPTTAGAFDTTFNGIEDAFVVKIADFGPTAALTWESGPPATLTLTPSAANTTVNTEHCVTATVGDTSGTPVPGVTVRFTVTGSVTADEAATTSTSGQAGFCYMGPSAQGTDTITAFADTNNSGTQDPDELGNTATKTWVVPAGLTLTPIAATNPVNTEHCVTATVGDASGTPMPGVTVHFAVTGSVTAAGAATTNASGQAMFCYTGPSAQGTDTITAFADTNNSGAQEPDEPGNSATKRWAVPAGCGPIPGINELTNRIYTANSCGDTVSVINGATSSVVATVTVAPGPIAVGVNETTNRIYVANSNGTVSVINGATNAVVATVTVGQEPIAVEINEITNRIYMANYADGFGSTLSVINGATSSVVATVTVGPGPIAVGVNERKNVNRIYVANSNGTVSVIDGATNAVVATVTTGQRPMAVEVNETTNRIYVANSNGTVSVIDGATSSVVATVTVGPGPVAVRINPDTNRIDVANYDDGFGSTVSVIDGATNAVIATVTVGQGPVEVGINTVTNRIYVANDSGTVSVINGATNAVVATVTTGQRPMGVEINEDTNRIYVANANGTVSVIDGATNSVVATVTVGQ
jgi:YVTN family beta-propeller protein